MSKSMGEELIESMQELLDYSEGKIDLRTSKISVASAHNTIDSTVTKVIRGNLKAPQSTARKTIGVVVMAKDSLSSEKYELA